MDGPEARQFAVDRVARDVITPLVQELARRLALDADADDRLAERVLADLCYRIWMAAFHAGIVETTARLIEQGAIPAEATIILPPLELAAPETLGDLISLEDLDGEG